MPYQSSSTHSREHMLHFFILRAAIFKGWKFQKVKDLVRKPLSHQPGWVRDESLDKGFTMFPVRNESEARKEWDYLKTHRLGIEVHWFTSETRESQPKLLKCNCSRHTPRTDEAIQQIYSFFCNPRTDEDLRQINSFSPDLIFSANTHQQMLYSAQSCATAYPAYSAPVPALGIPVMAVTPAYVPTPNGVPVNTLNGAARTESREIFVTELSKTMTKLEFEGLIKRAGNPVFVELSQDRNGKSEGNGVAYFQTYKDAEEAIQRLKEMSPYGQKLSVRPGTEKTTVSGPPPIANGSISYPR